MAERKQVVGSSLAQFRLWAVFVCALLTAIFLAPETAFKPIGLAAAFIATALFLAYDEAAKTRRRSHGEKNEHGGNAD